MTDTLGSTSLPWQQRIGNQRDWVWHGWRVRYTYFRAEVEPAAPPILLLHGFGASIGHWRHNLTVLGQHHTVYALDLLGFGASEKAAANYSLDLWVEQVYDFWRTFIRHPVVLVGNSLGSLVSMVVAAQHPEMVRGVVMLNLPDSSVLEAPPWLKPAIATVGPLVRPLAALVKGIFTTPPIFIPFFRLLRHPSIIRNWAKLAYASPEAITDELIEILSVPAADRRAARALRAMVRGRTQSGNDYRATVLLPTLQIPILMMWGLRDRMVPPLGEFFCKYNANIQLIEIEQAGHCLHDECPERVNQEILTWAAALMIESQPDKDSMPPLQARHSPPL